MADSDKLARIAKVLETGRDDSAGWTWTDFDKHEWTQLPDDHQYQGFFNHWHGRPFPVESVLPYELDLGTDEHGDPLLPFRPYDTSRGAIVARKIYSLLYERILLCRPWKRGAVITGQPGVGKSTFLKYMLARLVSERQVVIFYTATHVILFYKDQGEAYHAWTLLDVETGTPHIYPSCDVWPIQVSSPDPTLWNGWRNTFGAPLWGMDLWTVEELVCGFRLHPRYDTFREALKDAIRGRLTRLASHAAAKEIPSDQKVPTNVQNALEVLERELAFGYDEEDEDEEGKVAPNDAPQDVQSAGAEQDQVAANDALQHAVPSTAQQDQAVEDAMQTLVEDATFQVGFTPRAVYSAILTPDPNHIPNLLRGLTEARWLKILDTFISTKSLPSSDGSHLIAAVYPEWSQDTDDWSDDTWDGDWASKRLSKEMMIRSLQDHHSRRLNMFPGLLGPDGTPFGHHHISLRYT
ncbi:hypothetical protein C8Q80DRAFT_1271009 [Daedaleopsis nitida]|nr:hypothetical protein C8Q80DRAFT_1271009 [Daedaleopsis nitida]